MEDLKINIEQTVGTEHEIIAIDNREKHWPIAKAYNYGARKAKYPYLFFVHEDVKFHSEGWGNILTEKLAEPDCGVIGFAGSKVKLEMYSGWYQNYDLSVANLYQRKKNGKTEIVACNIFLDHAFEEVAILDGLGMFVKKEVWERHPFDEETLTGFHCYDLDFTIQIACAGLKNYVCCSNRVNVEHFSEGNMNDDWFRATIELHKKWKDVLPLRRGDFSSLDKRKLKRNEEKVAYNFLWKILRSDISPHAQYMVLSRFMRRPFSIPHFTHCITCALKYTRNVLGKKPKRSVANEA